MTTEDNATVVPPEAEKPPVAPEAAKDSAKVEVVVPKVDPKYAGKTIEEVIEMHKNAEALATKKAQEAADLKKQIVPRPTADELAKFFSPAITQEDDQTSKQVALNTVESLKNRFELDILKAELDPDMPEFKENAAEILAIAKSKPGIMWNNPDWTKDIYEQFMGKKLKSELPAKLQEAEERGKQSMVNKESQKIEASIISGSEAKAPPATPEPTREEKLKLVRQGKLKMSDILSKELSEAELSALNNMSSVKGKI